MQGVRKGFGTMQLVMVAATIGVASLVAVPKYQSHSDKVRIIEAFDLAAESQRRITQSFMINSNLPRTAKAANAHLSAEASRPEHVRELRIQPDPSGRTVRIVVYFNEGAVSNPLGGEQYIYIAGEKVSGGHYELEWQCGASNVDAALLPRDCQG